MALDEAQKKERSKYLGDNLKITDCYGDKPYVFISYASDDWETVFNDIVLPLQKQYGLCVYADKAFDRVNDKWVTPMLRNIRGAEVIIVFVSQCYIASYACLLELLTAANNKSQKQIVFVELEKKRNSVKIKDHLNIMPREKEEIFNQGKNIAKRTNNDSNDLMLAINSAYSSISTMLKDGTVSKLDISEAFIKFFDEALVSLKDKNDLDSIKSSIEDACKGVFDASLSEAEPTPSTQAESVPKTTTVHAESAKEAVPKMPNETSSGIIMDNGAQPQPTVNTASAQPQSEKAKPTREPRPSRLEFESVASAPAPASQASAVSSPSASAGEEYKLIFPNNNAYCAVIKIANGAYTLLKGSRLRSDCASSTPFASVKIRDESSRLDPDGNRIVFEDVVRNAPSSITGAIKGGSDNGADTVKFAKSISKDEIGNYLKSVETVAVKEPAYTAAPAPASQVPTVSKPSAPAGEEYKLIVSGNTYCAVIKIANGAYTLLKGSRLRSDCASSTPGASVNIREESSRLDPDGNRIVFEDVVRNAPSSITGAIKGGSDNGADTVKFAKSISKDEIGNYLKSVEAAAVKEPAYTAAPAPASQVPTVSEPSAPAGEEYKLIFPNNNAYCAVIKVADGAYTLLKGSRLRSDCASSTPFASVKIREESSRLDPGGKRIVFEDVVRNAPSSITGAIKGGSDNGADTVKSAESISKDEIGKYLKLG